MKNADRETFRAVAVSFWLAVVAFVAVLIITAPCGIGMTKDSVVYFQAARHAATGQGFLSFSQQGILEPMLHYPPLYPAVLAAGNYLGMDVFGWARMVNAFLFGLNVFLIAIMAFYITGRRRSALLSGWLALIFVQMVEIHSIALSEPLFISLMLLSLWMVMRYAEYNRMWMLVLAALLSGSSMLVRYGGLSVVAACAFALVIYPRDRGIKKLLGLLSFLVLSLSFPVVWAWRNIFLSGVATDIQWGFFPQALGNCVRGLNTLSIFLLPAGFPAAVRWVVLLLFLLGLAVAVRDLFREMRTGETAARLKIAWTVLGIFILVYLAGTVLTVLFISNGGMPLDRRVLLPLPAAAMALVPTLLRRRYFEGISRKMISLRVLVLLLFLGLMFLRTAQLAKGMYKNGFGYTSRTWTGAELVKTIRTLADDVPVYSNDPEAFYFFIGRPAIAIPEATDKDAPFLPLEQVQEHFWAHRAVAVIFEEESFRPHPIWWTVVRSTPLSTFMHDGWGSIYGFKRPPAAPSGPLRE